MNGYLPRSAALRIGGDKPISFGLATGQKRSRRSSMLAPIGGENAYRTATSASPRLKSRTASVPITSVLISGCAVRQRGRRGKSQRAANALVVVTRRVGAVLPARSLAAALENASKPARI